MNAHELGRRLLDGPDLPVIMAGGDLGDREPVRDVQLWETGEFCGCWWDFTAEGDPRRIDPAVEIM